MLWLFYLSSIMNLFGVLKFKKMGEDFVRSSGLPFTIIRCVICLYYVDNTLCLYEA